MADIQLTEEWQLLSNLVTGHDAAKDYKVHVNKATTACVHCTDVDTTAEGNENTVGAMYPQFSDIILKAGTAWSLKGDISMIVDIIKVA